MRATADLDELVREHGTDVRSYLRFLGCAPALADDLTQDCFLVVLRHPDRVAGKDVGAFLRRTARLLHLERRRADRRKDEILRLEAADVVWSRRCGAGGFDAYLEALDQCLETLSPRARELLDRHYRERRTGRDVAAAMGLTLANVNTMMHRTRARLLACIQRRVDHDL